jgi:hypothetical protein
LKDVENTDIGATGICKTVLTGKRRPDAIDAGLPDLLVHTFKCKNNANGNFVMKRGLFSENVLSS